MPDMYKKYKEEVVPAITKELGYKNVMQVPKLQKIVLSCGINTDADRSAFTEAQEQFTAITGQHAVITKSKKNVANFKLRLGQNNGVMVTLRGPRMYQFLDRFVHNATPRIRDFRGIPTRGFDGSGNYNMGLDDISVFTEVDLEKMKNDLGLNITFVTSAKTNEEAKALLTLLELPFKK